jgi:VIT1/CCC1 family predicted Fe2+/Mn2+ transporter
VDSHEIRRLLELWRDERNGVALYRGLSAAERDPRLSEVYGRLADAEERHAAVWQRRLEEAGVPLPRFKPAWRTRVLTGLARRFGVKLVLPSVAALERADADRYAGRGDAGALAADERAHARVISAASAGAAGLQGSAVAQLEGRHRTAGGNALRAAVLGANDGLVSNLSLVMGVAGADLAGGTILVTGVAGLLAGACSMALGEWLSVQSSRELYRRQIEIERAEIAASPEEEAEELALIYQARGLDEEQARAVASRILSDPANALDTLSREELGIDPKELGGSAWTAALTSFLLFAAGAVLPVLPFLVLDRGTAVLASVAAAALGLFVLGAGITLYTGRSVLFSGTRQVAFGLLAAAVTYAIGHWIGVSVP